MTENPHRLRAIGLISSCVTQLEEKILSGDYAAGQLLPPERQLAQQLGVSRPVIHQSLVDLAAKGLVIIHPRHGVTVCDYRKSGSTAILSALLHYQQGRFPPEFTSSLFAMRLLIEKETASLAALNADADQIDQLQNLVNQEKACAVTEIQHLTALDFEFHLMVSIASGNLVYPLILNSFKNVYTHFSHAFYQTIQSINIHAQVFEYQDQLVQAIKRHQPVEASQYMGMMLQHGERVLKGDLL